MMVRQLTCFEIPLMWEILLGFFDIRVVRTAFVKYTVCFPIL